MAGGRNELITRIKHLMEDRYSSLGRVLLGKGLSPNRLSLLGLVFSGFAAWFIFNESVMIGVLFIVGVGFADSLDGLVARSGNRVTVRGGYLDAMIDRVSDMLIIGAMLLGGWLEPLGWDWLDPGPLGEISGEAWALGALGGALLTSYARAAAERLGVKQEGIGLVERPERMIILMLGLLSGQATLALAILTVLGGITVGQRVIHFWKNAPS